LFFFVVVVDNSEKLTNNIRPGFQKDNHFSYT